MKQAGSSLATPSRKGPELWSQSSITPCGEGGNWQLQDNQDHAMESGNPVRKSNKNLQGAEQKQLVTNKTKGHNLAQKKLMTYERSHHIRKIRKRTKSSDKLYNVIQTCLMSIATSTPRNITSILQRIARK